ncbi:hypothetical protein K505DRAFT_254785 [Melanomma pulvis-pyrius CBS 109.77]|uniref:Protein SQS1 n=1 Tax=Melanomma pulvis-pyrius CBS 109.77 TaxID=1314802 RepID=A0A6A6WXW2_9PLEO|nr:hypothetical protein K505DRAFT_254785 [Melanomma pulvis-pyrius CBS 109.77]
MPKLSLVEEARWMSSHRSNAFEPGKQLRHLKIEFVSAGCLEGTIKEKEQEQEQEELPSPAKSPTNAHTMARMTIRSPSPTPSNSSSSEDEMVFRGRNTMPFTRATTTASAAASVSAGTASTTITTTITSLSLPIRGPPHAALSSKIFHDAVATPGSDPDSDTDSVVQDHFNRRLGGKSVWETNTPEWVHRSKPGIGWLPVSERPPMETFLQDQVKLKDAAMDDYMQNVQQFDTEQDMEATIPHSFVRRELDLETGDHNDWKEQEDSCNAENSQVLHGLSTSSDVIDDDEDTDDETMAIDDERLARILQNQEELGLSSDEALLYDDGDFLDHLMDAAVSSSGFDRPRNTRQNRARGSGRHSQPTFPSASVMADVLDMDPYNGFDIMDTERPSLRPRKKGRRSQIPPELEDSDLNEQLQATWQADRTTKRIRKAEREEMRKQGLLGRNGKAPDLSVKYQNGVTMPEIVEEIRDFLISDMQTLSLPPMEATRRATVHEFANKLGLKSRSRGGGHNRFTVLSKTLQTRQYDDDSFDALLEQKKFNNRLQRGPFRQGPKMRPTVSYKDGDTVGASAPELGPENKGHALMAKMGWSKGMALGALDNKGILQPIPHVVKTSKAGLQ